MNTLAKPCTLVEVEVDTEAVRAWKALYNFDTMDEGRLKPLPEFLFELKNEASKGKKHERPYRLYVNGEPCIGAQWQYTVEGAEWAAHWYASSFAHERRSSIYAYHRARHHATLREASSSQSPNQLGSAK